MPRLTDVLLAYTDANRSIICVNHDDPRVIGAALEQAAAEGVKIEVFDNALGWINGSKTAENNRDLAFFLENARSNTFAGQHFLVLIDCAARLREQRVITLLKRISYDNRTPSGAVVTVISVCADFTPPETLKEYVAIIDAGLPDDGEIKDIISAFAANCDITPDAAVLEEFPVCLSGLSEFQIEQTLNACYLDGGNLRIADKARIAEEKERLAAVFGVLQVINPQRSLESVCGEQTVKNYLKKKAPQFLNITGAKKSGVDFPVTAMFLGKSDSVKHALIEAAACLFKLPFARLELLSALKRFEREKILAQIGCFAPCVLQIDLSARFESSSDTYEFLALLDGICKKKLPAFVCLAPNGFEPPSFLSAAKQYLDEIFVSAAPTVHERADILTCALKKRGRLNGAVNTAQVAKAAEGLFEQDLELVVKDAVSNAFCAGRADVTTADLLSVLEKPRFASLIAHANLTE